MVIKTPSSTGPDGVVLVDKPAGWTSHDAVARLRRALNTRKVGHAGTLDPMATGLLIMGVGRGTRLLGYLVGLDKTYRATIRLGQATTTDDAEGELVFAAPPGLVASLGIAALTEAVTALTGQINQVPSAVSAIKVDGQRAYARVRAGQTVELAARPVTVHHFEVLGRQLVALPGGAVLDLAVEVTVSSGTYVRALARDLGQALGCGGHLTALRRLTVGPFGVDQAQALPVARSAVQPSTAEPAETASPRQPVQVRPLTSPDIGSGGAGLDQTQPSAVPPSPAPVAATDLYSPPELLSLAPTTHGDPQLPPELVSPVGVASTDPHPPPELLSLAQVAQSLFAVRPLTAAEATELAHGRFIAANPTWVGSKLKPVAGIGPDGQLVALLAQVKGQTRPLAVFTPA